MPGAFQTSLTQYPDALPPPGTRIDGGGHPPETLINDRANTAQVVDVAVTVVNSTDYQLEIDGVPIAYTSDASAAIGEIQAGLIAALAAAALAYPNGGVARVTMTAVAGGVRITEDSPELGAVVITESDANLALSTVTAHAQEEPLDGGQPVIFGTNPQSCRLPFGSGNIIAGIVERQHVGVELERYDTEHQYPARSQVPVCRKGKIVVTVEETVANGDPVFVRFAAGPGGTEIGAYRNDADSASAIQIPGAIYRRAASGGAKSVVEINLP